MTARLRRGFGCFTQGKEKPSLASWFLLLREGPWPQPYSVNGSGLLDLRGGSNGIIPVAARPAAPAVGQRR